MADKIDALFDDLQSRGFAQDKTREDFRNYMLAPGTQGYQNRKDFFEDFNLRLEHLYKSLTLFDENKQNFVDRIHSSLCEKYNRKTDILYYDVTNYFFEIDAEDELRKKGCSKEHRPLPIVQMGLFIDNQGLPVDYYLYEGNQNDCTTLKPSFEKIKKTYRADKVVNAILECPYSATQKCHSIFKK